MGYTSSYAAILAASERVSFRLDEVLPADATFDFGRSFLPESLVRANQFAWLDAAERRLLNQIRAHTYLGMFGLVEEFILPFVLDQVRVEPDGGDFRTRALLTFACEEAKHIHLFKRFRGCFQRGFAVSCDLIGPAEGIANQVLSHAPLSVALLILHIEWMTQRHFVESVHDDQALEPRFKQLLKVHWLEEAQHAKLDTHLAEALSAQLSPTERARSSAEYIELVQALDALLKTQVELDLAALEQATGRSFSEPQRTSLRRVQHEANRWTYLGSGMTHPRFIATLAAIDAQGAARVASLAREFC